jgi:hypothetical protein
MAGRPGPALFELIRDPNTGTAAASRQQASAVPVMAPRPMIEAAPVAELPAPPPMPVVRPIPDAERPRAWVTERDSGGPGVELGRSIPITTYAIGLAAAGLLGVLVVVGALSYKSGYRHGEADTLKAFGLTGQQQAVKDPLKTQPIPVNPNLLPQPTGRAAASPAAPPSTAEKPSAPTPAPTIVPGTDPRVPGHNYYTLASKVDRESAERMVDFLSQNGVGAFAVPVAKGSGSANNPGSFTVYALPGFTGEQMRARVPEKTDLEDRVHRLGKVWQKQHKGQTDFATAWWDKFGS